MNILSASPAGIDLAWDAIVGDTSLFGYEVLRSATAGGPYTMIARVTGNSHMDTAVSEGATYYYVVRSLDQSFNPSANSSEVTGTAQLRTVTLVINLTVPATTDATARSVYIAGFLDRLDGGLPQWNPGGVVLTRVNATTWAITLTGKEGTQIEYKYALGAWAFVEKGGACDALASLSRPWATSRSRSAATVEIPAGRSIDSPAQHKRFTQASKIENTHAHDSSSENGTKRTLSPWLIARPGLLNTKPSPQHSEVTTPAP